MRHLFAEPVPDAQIETAATYEETRLIVLSQQGVCRMRALGTVRCD